MIRLEKNQMFNRREDVGDLLGGDEVKGIAPSKKVDAVLLFTNTEGSLYRYFLSQKIV